MTAEQFTEKYKDALEAKYPNVVYTIIGNLAIQGDYDGKDVKHYLDNAYKEYQLSPDNFEGIVHKYSGSTEELYREYDAIQIDAIIPLIKPIAFLESLRELSRQNGLEKEPWVVYEQYNDQLVIVYAEDTPKSIRYFTQEEFDKMGIPKEDLFLMAVENLFRILPPMQRQGGEGLYLVTAGGDFEACLILLGGIWNNENFPVQGDLVVSIPNRDMLIVSGSEEHEKLQVLKEITKEAYTNGHHSLSPYLYKWDGERFVRFLTEAEKAVFN